MRENGNIEIKKTKKLGLKSKVKTFKKEGSEIAELFRN